MPSGLTFRNFANCPQNLFTCVVYISYETAIISLYINVLVFITESKCVYCTVRTESSNTFQVNSRLPSITSHHTLCRLYPKWFCIETDEVFSLKFTWLPELLCVNFSTQHPIGSITLGNLSYVFLPDKIKQCLRKLLLFMQTHRRTNKECHSITKCDVFRGWNEKEDKRAASTTGGCLNITLLQNATV